MSEEEKEKVSTQSSEIAVQTSDATIPPRIYINLPDGATMKAIYIRKD